LDQVKPEKWAPNRLNEFPRRLQDRKEFYPLHFARGLFFEIMEILSRRIECLEQKK
jgi:hypothetical protein